MTKNLLLTRQVFAYTVMDIQSRLDSYLSLIYRVNLLSLVTD
jgi:hypothetical protein